MSLFYPGTSTLVTHSYEERLTAIAEFDDALLDQASWKNSRYAGSRLTARNINVFTPSSSVLQWDGDESYQNLPVINKLSTALYISDTVIGGEENNQYVTLKGHSYVSISQILLIDLENNTVQILNKQTEPYEQFHRFITDDFSTGNSAILKVIENQNESVPNTLKGIHKVKMNKGHLLKTFTFQYAGEASASGDIISSSGDLDVYTDNNTMYLYSGNGGDFVDNVFETGSKPVDADGQSSLTTNLNNQLRFRYATAELFEADQNGFTQADNIFRMNRIGPKFNSSSIHENKFTQQYYSGSYGILEGFHSGSGSQISGSVNYNSVLKQSALGRASHFIAIDTLGFLSRNNKDSSLVERDKTEVHITFFQGTKDFAPGKDDERSIGTFEVDHNRAVLDIEQGDVCNGGLPVNHEFLLKGPNDGRFLPETLSHNESFFSAHLQNVSGNQDLAGCIPMSRDTVDPEREMQSGVTVDKIEDIQYFVQGGALGPIGRLDSSSTSSANYEVSNLAINPPRFTGDNAYSGSFHYEMSFLDKSHTLILDLDKEVELENGIGNRGLLVMPQNLHPKVAFNLEFYLTAAGITTVGESLSIQDINPNTNPNIQQNTNPPGLTNR
tara:strand:- start:3896 stop:5734 length:1839 start_codon:yes stop_codon:yes gene_type:complete